MRTINADALKEAIKSDMYVVDYGVEGAIYGMFWSGIENAIDEQPTAEPKTGKWKPWKAYYGKDHKSWSDELKCSECGYKWGDEEYKFCPMCGAEMEEPDE